MTRRAICARPFVWVPWVDAMDPSPSETMVLEVKEVVQGPAGGGGGQFEAIVPIRTVASKDGEIRLSGISARSSAPAVPAGAGAGAARAVEDEGRA